MIHSFILTGSFIYSPHRGHRARRSSALKEITVRKGLADTYRMDRWPMRHMGAPGLGQDVREPSQWGSLKGALKYEWGKRGKRKEGILAGRHGKGLAVGKTPGIFRGCCGWLE